MRQKHKITKTNILLLFAEERTSTEMFMNIALQIFPLYTTLKGVAIQCSVCKADMSQISKYLKMCLYA